MSIELAAYHERGILDQELAGIFAERLYVGNIHDYPDLDCYRSFTLGRKVITVRRTEEGIRAFGNVCLHRSNLIDPLGEGKRRFICGFHGWSYGAQGELAHAPFAEKTCIHRDALPRFPLADSQGLLFLGANGVAPDTSKIETAMQRTGVTLRPSFFRASILHHCNWKLLVENILESYHLNFVHRDTFLRSGFNTTSTHEWDADGYVNLASITPLAATSKASVLRRLARNAEHRYGHAYVFPNLFISNTNDLVGYVGHLQPVDEKSTILHWQLFELPMLAALPEAVREHIRKESIDFATQTLEEDRAMVEACQIGVSSALGNVQLQPIEDRIGQFHDYYNERMQHAR